jgi:hypothetical protein
MRNRMDISDNRNLPSFQVQGSLVVSIHGNQRREEFSCPKVYMWADWKKTSSRVNGSSRDMLKVTEKRKCDENWQWKVFCGQVRRIHKFLGASRIRSRQSEVRIRILPSSSKKRKKIHFLLASWRSLTKREGSGAVSLSQRCGSADPDPYQNVTDPLHWRQTKYITGYSGKERSS